MGQPEINELNDKVKQLIQRDTLTALPDIVRALLIKARTGDVEAIRELRLLVVEPLVTKHSSRPIAIIPASVQKALGWIEQRQLPAGNVIDVEASDES